MERHERAPGEEVGGYQILSTLGSGATGTVYRAQDGAGDLVALKVLHPFYAASQESRVRLMREVAALQKVAHPAVARVLDAEADDAEPFLVTELVDGPSLEDEVMGGGPLAGAELFELAQQLADALQAVHDVGLIHRDIKPSNIMVTRAGPVLIDFGIVQELTDARMTPHGFVMGTPGYLTPQMLDDLPPDHATDWWGWAGALVFAATGRAPFGVRPLETVLARVRSGTPDLAGLGPITQAALAGALEADPGRRLAPEVVLDELRRAADTGEEHVTPTPVVNPAVVTQDVPTVVTQDVPTRAAVLGGNSSYAQEGAMVAFAPVNPSGLSGAGASAVMPAVVPESGYPAPDDGYPHPPGPDFDDPGLEPGYVRPRARKRPWAILGLAIVPVLAAGLYPALAALVVLIVLVLLRTVAVTSDALHSRREVRGARRSDGVRHTLLFPWYLVRAAFGVVPAVLVAASSAVIVLGTLWWTLQTNRWVPAPVGRATPDTQSVDQIVVAGTTNQSWVFVAALCLMAVVALLILWFGPLSRPTREGARITLGHIAPGGAGALAVALLVLIVSAVLVLWLVLEKPVVWWPFTGPPDLS